MKDIDYMISVMQAYKEGKQIQWYTSHFQWEDLDEPDWCWGEYSYRVKPDEPKQKYRPFKDTNELISWWIEHYCENRPSPTVMPLIWLTNRSSGDICCITEFGGYANRVYFTDDLGSFGMDDLFRFWTFLDGETCGVKEGT